MEHSPSKLASQSRAGGGNALSGWEDILITFGRFGLDKDGTLISQSSVVQSKNAGSSSSLSDNDTPSAQKDPQLAASEVSMEREKKKECSSEIDQLPDSFEFEWPPASSVLQENISAQPNIDNGMTLVENRHSSIQNPSALAWNHQFHAYHSGNHVMSDDRNFIPGKGSQFFYGNHMMSRPGNISPVMGSQFCEDKLTQIRDGGHYMNKNIASSTHHPYQVLQSSSSQPDNIFLKMARTREGSEMLQIAVKQGNYMWTQEILRGVIGSIFELMIDDNGHHVFGALIENCRSDQLLSIVSKADSVPDAFIQVAFTDKGSKSIQRLIKRLKKTPMAQIITRILSKRCYELLTDQTGSHTIRQCFVVFADEPNLMLYQAIASRLADLATHPVGCISLNNFIDTVTGAQRVLILDHLAKQSLFLSNDPSGNFVVQHMLNLSNEQVTDTILRSLKGNFEQLAQKQGGSHVVEKCMKSSVGLELVVSEIIKDGKTLFRLAKDQFGNYVIQTALKKAKMMSDKTLHVLLLQALSPYYPYLLVNTRGRHVAELIREDLGLQKPKSN